MLISQGRRSAAARRLYTHFLFLDEENVHNSMKFGLGPRTKTFSSEITLFEKVDEASQRYRSIGAGHNR